MSYTTDDFSESLQRVSVPAIASVVAAWGRGDGMGTDAGHWKWSEAGASDWAGGFLLKLHDGRYAYVTGWCDYTGWGCQDGAWVGFFDREPSVAEMAEAAAEHNFCMAPPSADEWDREPSDLNRWLASQVAGE